VAGAALDAYLDTGFQPDAVPLLDQALARGMLDRQAYGRALVALLRAAPPPWQSRMAGWLADSGDFAVADDAAGAAGDAHLKLGADAAAPFLRLLRTHQPQLGRAGAAVSLESAQRYACWLHALARLAERAGMATHQDTVLATLAGADDGRALSYLASPAGQDFVFMVGKRARLRGVDAAAARAVALHPGHPVYATLGAGLWCGLGKLKD